MSGILAVSCNPTDGMQSGRFDSVVSSLGRHGRLLRKREIPVGVIAAACPEAAPGQAPFADLAESGGAVAACHGSLYDLGELYEEMGVPRPPGVEANPARAVLDAYLRWGQGAIRYWTGEASFAIWDPRQRLLLAGRDHLGVRPLFFWVGADMAAVSTDIGALLAVTMRSPEPDPVMMRRFLCQGHFHDERSFFLRIRRLQPGCMVMIRQGRLTESRYWRLEDAEPIRFTNPEDYGEGFVEVLSKALSRRHVESPHFGSSLSGGLDSSSMVCLTRELREKSGYHLPIPVSAVVFTGSKYDESRYLNAVIRSCGTAGAVTTPEYWDVFAEWEKLTEFHDEPATAMSIAIFWIQKVLARDLGIKIQLSGAGADEVLAGELHYFADLLRRGRIPELASEISRYAEVNSMGHSRGRAALFFRYALAPLMPVAVRDLRRKLSSTEKFPWLGAALAKLPREREPLPAPGFRDVFHREMAVTLQARYTPLLLHYEDRNSAEVGVESRFPYLDLDVVRYCFGLPRSELMSAGQAKIVLKRAMRGVLPEEVWQRQAKSGIPDLITRWLTQDYRQRVSKLVVSSRLVEDGWLNGPELEKMFERYACGERGLRRRFWRALALEGWYRHFWP